MLLHGLEARLEDCLERFLLAELQPIDLDTVYQRTLHYF